MKVSELINKLSDLDQDKEIYAGEYDMEWGEDIYIPIVKVEYVEDQKFYSLE